MAKTTTDEPRTEAVDAPEATEAQAPEHDGDGTLRRAAMTAAAAAIAGGLAGAAQELLSRRGAHDDAEEPQREAEPLEEPSAEAEQEEPREGPSAGADEEEPSAEAEQEEPREDPSAEAEEDEGAEGDEHDEPVDRAEEDEAPALERDGKRPEPVASGPAGDIVGRARDRLRELAGDEPESVSGMRRADGGWAVTFEVVEVHRIPETTDVLSSYEVTVDDDGSLIGFERKRRYRRSQVDEG